MSYDFPQEAPTGEPKPLVVGVIMALETTAAAMEVAGATESPIESMFAGALTAALRRRYAEGAFGIFNPGEPNEHPDGTITLIAQFDLLRFRYDFAMRVQGAEKPFLLIECGSKQFHSSPAQIANDRRKDDCAFNAGFHLLRFTGPEIHYRIDKCVATVIGFLEDIE